MALRELTSRFGALLWKDARPLIASAKLQPRRHASTAPTEPASVQTNPMEDLEPASSLATSLPVEDVVKDFDPVARAKARKDPLPPSRYQYRPPKYYRGPLHPHQPPRPSDPASRQFIPGPFTLPRLEQTYDSTIASDFMTLTYVHFPPGYTPPKKGPRLRSWEGDSPYFKNRPLRDPRGGDVLRLLRRPITFRNIPKVTGVTVHTMVKEAMSDSAHLHVAGMVVQAITNVRVTTHKATKAATQFGMRGGRHLSLTAEVKGEDMYHFLGKCIDVVMPRIKDWKGVKGSAGDNSGNITFGLSPEAVAMFPEVEVNYDMYPSKMIPGCHVTVRTSATNDRDARLLLSSMGIPFYGKFVD